MTTVSPHQPRLDHVQHEPPPVEWSSDHTARMVTQLAADVATIRRWTSFFGVFLTLWVIGSGLTLLMILVELKEASS